MALSATNHTQLRVPGLPGGAYRHWWPFDPRITFFSPEVDAPGNTPELLARIGGEIIHEAYYLGVTHPVTKWWALAPRAFRGDDIYAGGWAEDWDGIVVSTSGAQMAAALGGQGGGGITLEIADHLGTYPGASLYPPFIDRNPRKRWSDQFDENVPGYSERYDLESMELRTWYFVKEAASWVPAGLFRLDPGSIQRKDDRLSLSFIEDPRLDGLIPRRVVTPGTWPWAPPDSIGRAIPVPFGNTVRLPGILTNAGEGQYLLCESPAATPVSAIHRVYIYAQDPVTRTIKKQVISSPPTNPVAANWPAGGITEIGILWVNFTERAQPIVLDEAMLSLSYTIIVRKDPYDPAPLCAGTVTLTIVYDRDGKPSEDMVDGFASGEFDASLVNGPAPYWGVNEYGFHWANVPGHNPPAFLPAGVRLWFVERYSPASGASRMQRGIDNFGNYSRHRSTGATERGSGRDEWLTPVGAVRLLCPYGFGGDGTIAEPDLCGQDLWDFHTQPGYKALLVGPDFPCGKEAMYRSFLRFDIENVTHAGLNFAFLYLYLATRSVAVNSTVHLYEVVDYGELTAGDYNGVVRSDLGAIPAMTVGGAGYIQVNVTTAFRNAKNAGLSHICFRLQCENESPSGGPSRWYGFVATENGWNTNVMDLSYSGRVDHYFRLHGLQWGQTTHAIDAAGHGVAHLQFYRDLGDRAVAADVGGLVDTTPATYTYLAGSLIWWGPDIAHWIMRSPVALGLPAARVDIQAFITARNTVASLYGMPFVSTGILAEQAPASTWLARIGRCCLTTFFPDAEGRMTCWTEGVVGTTHPTVLAELQAGDLAQSALAGQIAGLPWTRVEVFFDRDLLDEEHDAGNKVAGWHGYSVVDPIQVDPWDPVRYAQSVALQARYGVRGNSGIGIAGILPGGPTEDNSFYFLGPTATESGWRMRNRLWDLGSRRPHPFEVITLALPRFALIWKPMDRVPIEAQAFPGPNAKLVPGLWSNAPTADGAHFAPEEYQARRGLFSVRVLNRRLAAGADWPVRATLQLIYWEN